MQTSFADATQLTTEVIDDVPSHHPPAAICSCDDYLDLSAVPPGLREKRLPRGLAARLEAAASSVYFRHPDGNLLEFMIYGAEG